MQLFDRRKEAIIKNKFLLDTLFLKQDKNIIAQFAALFYLRFVSTLKLQKEIELVINRTAAQACFQDIHKQVIAQTKLYTRQKFNKHV